MEKKKDKPHAFMLRTERRGKIDRGLIISHSFSPRPSQIFRKKFQWKTIIPQRVSQCSTVHTAPALGGFVFLFKKFQDFAPGPGLNHLNPYLKKTWKKHQVLKLRTVWMQNGYSVKIEKLDSELLPFLHKISSFATIHFFFRADISYRSF